MTDPVLLSQCFDELTVCDAEHRDRIRFLVERKVRSSLASSAASGTDALPRYCRTP